MVSTTLLLALLMLGAPQNPQLQLIGPLLIIAHFSAADDAGGPAQVGSCDSENDAEICGGGK